MENIQFVIIPEAEIDIILPFMERINSITPKDILRERVLEMASQNYKCIGIYCDNNLIGICGLWFMTRHYCGKSVEPDHVIIDESYQGKGLGKQLFEWIFAYCRANGIEATELNTYVENTRSHKFYYNMGYEIKGYHFLKIID